MGRDRRHCAENRPELLSQQLNMRHMSERKERQMHVTDTEIERTIRDRVNALASLPAVLMPFDPDAGEQDEALEASAFD